ncbi:PTR2-domain-containing protein [Aureobasidium pullulans EXF-150]|uniref:PTR2-domain-containing protein n=1 Tax=Aureobasidium pullulans EXF-150 TaxID=1043002 RepID=A0A074XDH1_AURPU|nr:PTR2-domain-containing protein [Aureobasidium pullulans EXF-150]KEQ83575.1 PTR2-domain-containing protein [Aureobasidium pullulans EXF-150]
MDVGKAEPLYEVRTPETEVYDDLPTEEDLKTLRRVSGKINWAAYTVAFAELAERFSYYGSSILYTNFVQWPLPEGSRTGAGGLNGQPGALGMGQSAAQGISLFNQFFAYFMPLIGGYVADAHLGRYKTIHIAIVIGIVAHIILVAASAPDVIIHKTSATAAFIIGLLTLCVGTGFFKANISPLLAEQNTDRRMRVETLPTGERVLVDPSVTNSRIFLVNRSTNLNSYFYFAVNIGSLTGQISMVYVEKFVGFWLAFLLPTVLFVAAPVVLFFNRKNYILSPPTGSILSKFFHMLKFSWKNKQGSFKWDVAKPSNVPAEQRPVWMTYDDAWVDEVKRGLSACKVFLFLPLFFLAYNQMTGNLTSQAAVLQLGGVPNDIIQNLNPISIVIMIPILDHVIYPGFRKIGFAFTPIKRMTVGFFFAAASMVAAAVMQHYIYVKSPCGKSASDPDCIKEFGKADISVWAQVLPYIFIGIAEIFTNVTSLEYAYAKAPANMKSMVMSINLFMSAFASAIGQAFTPLSEDPLLVWNYTIITILAFLGGVGFWFCFRDLDANEDKLNMLERSNMQGKNTVVEPKDTEAQVQHVHEQKN